MTDVFKKINDMLKEKKDDYDDMYRIFKKGGDKQLAYTTHEILKVIKSIRQMIGEMEKEYNDGWIPCKKDLPKISDSYLVTKMYENDGNPIYETAHEIFWIKDMKWDCERDEFCVWKVIAWQNKLTPYRPEGDKNE